MLLNRTTEDKKARKSILNHEPADFVKPDSVFSKKIKEKHLTTASPKVAHMAHV